ncbi:hypothetical protein POVWA2_049410 [Plasmodium ovale wallikeri]|uniref:Uncharacterized protein n=1 Tax=Plasmodium ovale wallikeri TaxID=864142 RepID=A0A1A8ZM69_PLAOA|nr:hypothetical protein POVWA1_040880 [Plasmodium ovale wallikeri]SBT45181.1 hypothetical protein POVWA2_049410 [Plasmodium ovale wallikeri]
MHTCVRRHTHAQTYITKGQTASSKKEKAKGKKQKASRLCTSSACLGFTQNSVIICAGLGEEALSPILPSFFVSAYPFLSLYRQLHARWGGGCSKRTKEQCTYFQCRHFSPM